MKRINIYLSEEQLEILENYPGTVSEHIREAIDLWIEKKKNLKVTISPSERRKNGK